VKENGYNIFHAYADYRNDYDCSDHADILRFLFRCFPEGVTALNNEGDTPYALLNHFDVFARRFLLLNMGKLDPTSILLYRDELRRLNYEARKLALFAFFSSASEWNIFTRIRWASDGESLMRTIVRFL